MRNNSLTGTDIRDLRSGDIRDRAIRLRDLHPEVLARLTAGRNGANGANGENGATGPGGATGATGAAGQNGTNATISSGNWGVIARNTIGSPDIFTRSGPFTPPLGSGSLGLSVGTPAPDKIEKAAYGNETDFTGDAVADLNAVGFSVYTTGENAALGNPNMPSISIEIDPNLTATPSNFSTLVFVPNNTTRTHGPPSTRPIRPPASGF